MVLFGPTAPDQWGPRTRARHVPLWAGSRGDPHADRPDPGLLAIGVPDVVAAKKLLAENPHAIAYIDGELVDDSVRVISP